MIDWMYRLVCLESDRNVFETPCFLLIFGERVHANTLIVIWIPAYLKHKFSYNWYNINKISHFYHL